MHYGYNCGQVAPVADYCGYPYAGVAGAGYGGYPYAGVGFGGNPFVLVVVLFILLIIIGCSCGTW